MAANKIKGLTIEINGDVKPLNKALESTNSISKELKKGLVDIEKALKLDPTNIELTEKKTKLLSEAIQNTEEKLKTLKTAAEQATDKLAKGEITQAQFDKLTRDIQSTENALKSLNSQAEKEKVSGALDRFRANAKEANTELKKVENTLKLDPSNVVLLEQKQKLLNETINATSGELTELKAKAEEAQKQLERGEISEKQFRAIQREVAYTEGNLKKLKDEAKDFGSVFAQQMEQAGKKMQEVGDKIEGVGKKMLPISGAVAGVGVAAAKSAIDYESAFAGVQKTVDATDEQLEQLSEGIRDMSKEIPASAVAISGVAEAAGQLGIKTDNILSFTRTMIDLGEATNLTSEDAASSLAQFANITQMSQKDFDKLGSVIVALGNNLATTEADIVSMGQRLAGAGSQVGLSEAQIMAFAGALSSVGIEADAGGSAFSKVMVDMQLAVETGSERLSEFANVAGMSADEFQKAFKDDAAGAIISFIQGLGSAEDRGMSAIKVLDDMGITEVRLRDSLLRAAGASGVFTNAIDLGNKAWDENTALAKEAEQRYETSASQIEIAKNVVVDFGRDIGKIIVPALLDFMKGLKGIVEWLSNLSPEALNAIVVIGGIVAALAPVLIFTGKVIDSVGKITEGLSKAGPIISGIKSAFTFLSTFLTGTLIPAIQSLAATIVSGLGSAFTFLAANPIVLIIAAITALVAGIIYLWNTNEDFRNAIIGIWEKIKSAGEALWGWLADFFTVSIPNAIQSAIDWFKQLPDRVSEFFGELPGKIGYALGYALGTIAQWGIDAINWIIEEVPKQIENIINFYLQLPGKLWNIFVLAITNLVKWITDMANKIKVEIPKIINSIVDFFSVLPGKMLDIGVNIVKGLWDGIKNTASWLMDKITDFASGIIDGFKDAFDINSPSKILEDEVGKMLGLGVAEGLYDSIRDVRAAMDALNSEITVGGISGAGSTTDNRTTNNTNNSNIVINNHYTVRNDNDTKTIIREQKKMLNNLNRARGVVTA